MPRTRSRPQPNRAFRRATRRVTFWDDHLHASTSKNGTPHYSTSNDTLPPLLHRKTSRYDAKPSKPNHNVPSHIPYNLSGKDFADLGKDLIKECRGNTFSRRFKRSFGITPYIVSCLWRMIVQKGYLNNLGPRSIKPVHLLWALMLLRCYHKEEINAERADCDEKTFRKWAWFYAECIADLDSHLVRITMELQLHLLNIIIVVLHI